MQKTQHMASTDQVLTITYTPRMALASTTQWRSTHRAHTAPWHWLVKSPLRLPARTSYAVLVECQVIHGLFTVGMCVHCCWCVARHLSDIVGRCACLCTTSTRTSLRCLTSPWYTRHCFAPPSPPAATNTAPLSDTNVTPPVTMTRKTFALCWRLAPPQWHLRSWRSLKSGRQSLARRVHREATRLAVWRTHGVTQFVYHHKKSVDVERIVSYIEPCRFQLSSNLLLNETQECTKRDGWGKEREMERGSKRHDSWNGLHNNRGEGGGCM